MPTTLNREEFLHKLQSCAPGLSVRDIIHQSSCFVFQNAWVKTFNDEVSCKAPSGLPKDFAGAVTGKPLTDLLAKLVEEEVEIDAADGRLTVRGKGKLAGVNMEAEVLLPVHLVEKPGEWRKLPDDFAEAVNVVKSCAGKQENQSTINVSVTSEWIEAHDNVQACRWRTKSAVEGGFLARHDSLGQVATLGVDEFSQGESWVHFRNPQDVVVSIRRQLVDYLNLDRWFDVKGEKAMLPKGMAEAAEKAMIFTSDGDANLVEVLLQPGKVRVRGQGAQGFYQESRKIKYEGRRLQFLIAPQILMDVVKNHNECLVNENVLFVDAGKFQYVTCLSKLATSEETVDVSAKESYANV